MDTGLSEMLDDMVTKARAEGYKEGYDAAVAEVQALVGANQAMVSPVPSSEVPPQRDRWLTNPQAAEYLGTTTKALDSRRNRGSGPAWERRGARVRYRLSALDSWLAEGQDFRKPWASHNHSPETKARIKEGSKLTSIEAAEYLGVTRKMVENFRTRGNGPKSRKEGGRVWWYKSDLDAWKAARDE